MQVKDIFEAIGELFQFTFQILPTLGNLPNLIFLILGSVLFLYWMLQMSRQSEPTDD